MIISRFNILSRRWVYSLIFSLIILIVSGVNKPYVYAQGGDQWSSQQRIPDYGNESRPPCLVADLDHTVYSFNDQRVGDEQAIFYRKWSIDQGWSVPLDIILSPLPEAPQVQGCLLDQSGMMHLVFYAGNERGGAIYYSRARAIDAGKAPAWSKPAIVGQDALASAAMAGDKQGDLFILFSGKKQGVGLYEIYSTDGGVTWSQPALVFLVEDIDLIPYGTRLTIDQNDRLHAVWSVVNTAGIDQAIYYARFGPDHRQWSQPVILAKRDEGDYKAAWPAIISYKGELMVVYQDGFPATRWMRRSYDDGSTWSAPVRPWQLQGEYEHAVLLVDSNNSLHIILGNRNGDCCHGMWHGVWLGESWSQLEPIVMGPKTSTFDPSAPRAVISQGNVLLVVWWTDTGGGPRNGAWYSYTRLNAPEIPTAVLPLPQITSTPTLPAALIASFTTQTPMPNINFATQADQGSTIAQPDNPGIPIYIGIFSALLFFGVVIIFKYLYHHIPS